VPSTDPPPARRSSSQFRLRAVVLAFLAAAVAIAMALAIGPSPSRVGAGNATLVANPNLDSGTRVLGLPATIYIDRGRVVKTVSGQYDSLGAPCGDIQHHAGV
jgi:hypothetical protein